MKIKTILFDLDNTLVRCMIYYSFIRQNINYVLAKESGYSPEYINDIMNTIETERIKEKNGYSKSAFIDTINRARVAIYNKLKEDESPLVNQFYASNTSFKLISFASEVYNAPYTIYEDVPDVLNTLKNKGYSLIVVTKGDFYGQSRKAANLPKLFDGLFVLPYKNKFTWNGVVETMQLERDCVLVVGDSVQDDINPALAVGLKAVRINRLNTEWVGDIKTKANEDVEEIATLLELIKILDNMQ